MSKFTPEYLGTSTPDITLSGDDGADLNVGAGGALGSAAFTNVEDFEATIPDGTFLQVSENLSEVTPSAARGNLGLGTLATQNGTFSGTSSGSNTGDQTNISGNAATSTSTSAANLTGNTLSAGVTASSLTSFGSSPTLVAPNIGAATATTINGAAIDNSAWTTYAPTATASTGTFTSVSTSGRYKQIGKTVFFSATIIAATIGTAAGRLIVTLPINTASGLILLSGNGNGLNSVTGALNFDVANAVSVILYNGSFPFVSNGQGVNFVATYEVT